MYISICGTLSSALTKNLNDTLQINQALLVQLKKCLQGVPIRCDIFRAPLFHVNPLNCLRMPETPTFPISF